MRETLPRVLYWTGVSKGEDTVRNRSNLQVNEVFSNFAKMIVTGGLGSNLLTRQTD